MGKTGDCMLEIILFNAMFYFEMLNVEKQPDFVFIYLFSFCCWILFFLLPVQLMGVACGRQQIDGRDGRNTSNSAISEKQMKIQVSSFSQGFEKLNDVAFKMFGLKRMDKMFGLERTGKMFGLERNVNKIK